MRGIFYTHIPKDSLTKTLNYGLLAGRPPDWMARHTTRRSCLTDAHNQKEEALNMKEKLEQLLAEGKARIEAVRTEPELQEV